MFTTYYYANSACLFYVAQICDMVALHLLKDTLVCTSEINTNYWYFMPYNGTIFIVITIGSIYFD